MKATELIKKLQEMIDEHGDIEVQKLNNEVFWEIKEVKIEYEDLLGEMFIAIN